ncbi:MAG: hypothetical protein ACI97B_003221 [Verrucomicrobiales bacterium]|jgi:hypothetical protein
MASADVCSQYLFPQGLGQFTFPPGQFFQHESVVQNILLPGLVYLAGMFPQNPITL